jgi:hypothetical protein
MPGQIAATLATHGIPQPIIDDELERMREHRATGTANRSVVGIMNEFTFLATTHRAGGGRADLLDLSLRLAPHPVVPLPQECQPRPRTRRYPALHRHLTVTAIAQHPVACCSRRPPAS